MLKDAILKNRRRDKYRGVLRRLRLNYFQYEDAGKLEKYERLVARIQTII